MYVPRRRLLMGVAVTAVVMLALWCWISPAAPVHAPASRAMTVGVVGDDRVLKEMGPEGIMTRARLLPMSAVYEPLVTCTDPAKGPRPLLAMDWRWSPDGKTVELELKKKANFHNGKPLEASYVKKCWEKTLLSLTDQECINLFAPIVGYDQCLRGGGQISGIEVTGKHSLKIKLNAPNSFFISSLASPVFWVYDPEATAQVPAGTGPYKFTSIDEKGVQLTPYPRYHGGVPQLPGLNFVIFANSKDAMADFKKGTIDVIDEVSPSEIKDLKQAGDSKGKLISRPLLAMYACGFNLTKEPYAENYLLRRALNYAIDRKAIIDDILAGGGLPAKGPLPQGISGYSASTRGYTYDPDKAKKLLSDAGYPGGKGLPALELLYPRDPGHRQIAESVREQLSTLGVEVHLKELLMPQVQSQIRNLSTQSFTMVWNADYAEGYDFLYYLYSSHSIGRGNYTGYRIPQVDSLLKAAAAETKSTEDRAEYLRRAAGMVTDDAPMLWLYQPKTTKLIGNDVRDFNVNGMNEIEWVRVWLEGRGTAAEESKT